MDWRYHELDALPGFQRLPLAASPAVGRGITWWATPTFVWVAEQAVGCADSRRSGRPSVARTPQRFRPAFQAAAAAHTISQAGLFIGEQMFTTKSISYRCRSFQGVTFWMCELQVFVFICSALCFGYNVVYVELVSVQVVVDFFQFKAADLAYWFVFFNESY